MNKKKNHQTSFFIYYYDHHIHRIIIVIDVHLILYAVFREISIYKSGGSRIKIKKLYRGKRIDLMASCVCVSSNFKNILFAHI